MALVYNSSSINDEAVQKQIISFRTKIQLMKKSFKQILSIALLCCSLVFMNSCKKDPIHFKCPISVNYFCMPDTTNGYSTYGFPNFAQVSVADIQNRFAGSGYTFDLKKIKSAKFSSIRITSTNDSILMQDLTFLEVRIRKDSDTQLGNQVGYRWLNNDSIASAELTMTGSDINGTFNEDHFTFLTRIFTVGNGNKAICLQPSEIVIDFELDASAKK